MAGFRPGRDASRDERHWGAILEPWTSSEGIGFRLAGATELTGIATALAGGAGCSQQFGFRGGSPPGTNQCMVSTWPKRGE